MSEFRSPGYPITCCDTSSCLIEYQVFAPKWLLRAASNGTGWVPLWTEGGLCSAELGVCLLVEELETYKIHISLGLNPLTKDKAPANDKEQDVETYAKRRRKSKKQSMSSSLSSECVNMCCCSFQEDCRGDSHGAFLCRTVTSMFLYWPHRLRHHRRTELLYKLIRVRNHMLHSTSLVGATLSDADGDDDTFKWIKRSKKRKNLQGRGKRSWNTGQSFPRRIYQACDTTASASNTPVGDLEGLKVSHVFDTLDEGESGILMLKDSHIISFQSWCKSLLEDDLQNVKMAKEEVHQKMRTKQRDYTGYDDEEFKNGNQGVKRTILAKSWRAQKILHFLILSCWTHSYAFDMKRFRLGSAVVSKKVKREEEKQSVAVAVNKSLLSIDCTSLLLRHILMGILQKTLIFCITSKRAKSVSKSQRRVGCRHAVWFGININTRTKRNTHCDAHHMSQI